MATNETTDDPLLLPIKCQQGVLPHADGSAVFRYGETTVMAVVYGPTEPRGHSQRLIDRAVTEITFQPKVGQLGVEGRVIERLLVSVCDNALLSSLHPAARFTIALQELHDAGGLLAACVNACCAAMLDASAPMRWCMAAVTCVTRPDGSVVVQPTRAKREGAVAEHTFVFDGRHGGVVCSETVTLGEGGVGEGVVRQGEGEKRGVGEGGYRAAMEACREASTQIFDLYREMYVKRTATRHLA